jgi:uncharacterized protein with PQ loop repeat
MVYPLAEAAGWVAAILAGVMPIPQAYRVRRVGAAGVSRASWQFLLWAVVGWLGFGVVTRETPTARPVAASPDAFEVVCLFAPSIHPPPKM